MSFSKKEITKPSLRIKGANGFLLCGVFAITLGFFLNSESIKAQIGNLYNDQNDQVAGITSLMSAVASDDLDGVKFFSKAGTAIVNQKNYGGATGLHLASRNKNIDIARVLIENGADVNVADNEGWTPLMRSALAADNNMVMLLLEKGAQATELNSIGESVIVQASLSDCTDCLSVMFEKYNFIKLMDYQLLKDQLNAAYVIAQSHDNAKSMEILTAYQDRVVKMSSLSDNKGGVQEESLNHSVYKVTNSTSSSGSSSSGKRFKFLVGEGESSKKEIKSVSPVNKISVQKKDVPSVTQESVPAKPAERKIYKFSGKSEDKLMQESLKEIKLPANDPVVAPAAAAPKQFKFKQGEEGKAVNKPVALKEEVIVTPISTFVEEAKPATTTATKPSYKFKSAN